MQWYFELRHQLLTVSKSVTKWCNIHEEIRSSYHLCWFLFHRVWVLNVYKHTQKKRNYPLMKWLHGCLRHCLDDVSACKCGCQVGKGEYLLKNKLWKCCMSDEDESATAFVMQWRWPIKYKTVLSVMRYTVISATTRPRLQSTNIHQQ